MEHGKPDWVKELKARQAKIQAKIKQEQRQDNRQGQDSLLRDKLRIDKPILTDEDFYPPEDTRYLNSGVDDIEDGDNFADYAEYYFDLYDNYDNDYDNKD